MEEDPTACQLTYFLARKAGQLGKCVCTPVTRLRTDLLISARKAGQQAENALLKGAHRILDGNKKIHVYQKFGTYSTAVQEFKGVNPISVTKLQGKVGRKPYQCNKKSSTWQGGCLVGNPFSVTKFPLHEKIGTSSLILSVLQRFL